MRQKYHFSAAADAQVEGAYDAFTRTHSHSAIQACADALGMPHWRIKRRARELGLARTKEKDWSSAELAILIENRFYSPTGIRRRLKQAGYERTVLGVLLKRKRLRLTTRNHEDGYTANALAKLLNVDAHVVTRWIAREILPAERRETLRTPQQGGDSYWVRTGDLRAFIFEFPEEIDLRKVDPLWFIELLRGENIAIVSDEEHF